MIDAPFFQYSNANVYVSITRLERVEVAAFEMQALFVYE